MNDSLYDLIISSKNGDKESILKLINKFSPLINKYSKKLSYDDSNTELIYIMPINDFVNKQNEGLIVNYIVKSIKNRYIYLSKKYKNITCFEKTTELDYVLPDKFSTNMYNNIIIYNMLNALSDSEKKIIIEIYFKDKTVIEIAEKLKISRQAVNKTKNKALKKLKKELIDV